MSLVFEKTGSKASFFSAIVIMTFGLVAGCSSRANDPVDIEAHSLGRTPICRDIGARIDNVNRDMLALASEVHRSTEKNAAKAALQVFATALIGTAYQHKARYAETEAARKRLSELETENRKLAGKASSERCGPVRALSREGALFLRSVHQSNPEERNDPESQLETGTAPRIYLKAANAPISAPARKVPPRSKEKSPPSNRELMKKFLAGEISEDQYNKLRSGQ